MKKFKVNLKLARVMLANRGFQRAEVEPTSIPFLFTFVSACGSYGLVDTLSHTVTIEEIAQ